MNFLEAVEDSLIEESEIDRFVNGFRIFGLKKVYFGLEQIKRIANLYVLYD